MTLRLQRLRLGSGLMRFLRFSIVAAPVLFDDVGALLAIGARILTSQLFFVNHFPAAVVP